MLVNIEQIHFFFISILKIGSEWNDVTYVAISQFIFV